MEKFTYEELSLIDHIISLILKKDNKFNLSTEDYYEENPELHHTERLFKLITYGKADFRLYFDKYYINEEPVLKSKINKFFSENKTQTPRTVYPRTGDLRTMFQKGEVRGWSQDTYEIWNKQLIVKGIIISDAAETLYFHNNKATEKLYIQTNDIDVAKEKINKFFFKLLMDAIEREIAIIPHV